MLEQSLNIKFGLSVVSRKHIVQPNISKVHKIMTLNTGTAHIHNSSYRLECGAAWPVPNISRHFPDYILRCIFFIENVWISINTLRPIQSGRRFADDVFKCIFLMEMYEFCLKFHWSLFLRLPINNIPALVQIMAWRRSGDKPLSEPIMLSL